MILQMMMLEIVRVMVILQILIWGLMMMTLEVTGYDEGTDAGDDDAANGGDDGWHYYDHSIAL